MQVSLQISWPVFACTPRIVVERPYSNRYRMESASHRTDDIQSETSALTAAKYRMHLESKIICSSIWAVGESVVATIKVYFPSGHSCTIWSHISLCLFNTPAAPVFKDKTSLVYSHSPHSHTCLLSLDYTWIIQWAPMQSTVGHLTLSRPDPKAAALTVKLQLNLY